MVGVFFRQIEALLRPDAEKINAVSGCDHINYAGLSGYRVPQVRSHAGFQAAACRPAFRLPGSQYTNKTGAFRLQAKPGFQADFLWPPSWQQTLIDG